ALAMFRFAGRGGPADRDAAAKLLATAAKLGHGAAAYDLGLLYLEGQLFPQDFARAAEMFRAAAEAGNREAQYALATLYKERSGAVEEGGAAGKPDRPEPPGQYPGGWPRAGRRSGRGDQMASRLAGTGSERPRPRRLHAPPAARRTRRWREGGTALDRGLQAAA